MCEHGEIIIDINRGANSMESLGNSGIGYEIIGVSQRHIHSEFY